MQLMSNSVIGVLFVHVTKNPRSLPSSSSATPDNSNRVPGWVSQNLFGSCLPIRTNYWGWNTRLCHRPIPLARSWASTPEPHGETGKDGFPKGKHRCLSVLSWLCPSGRRFLVQLVLPWFSTEYHGALCVSRLAFWGGINSCEAAYTSCDPVITFHIHSQWGASSGNS